MAVVLGEETAAAVGYGYRDLASKLPVTSRTTYPIASTTKAMNATFLGLLVAEGRLAWDAPVRRYLPAFEVHDHSRSGHVTLRDLVAMRTGLPRHDILWLENPIDRSRMVECLAHLSLSADLRERYQYNNLTPATAGHVAEVVTGERWEDLIRQRLLNPLGMVETGFSRPLSDSNTTQSYYENHRRELVETRRFSSEVISPAGGAIHSTVEDMARWIALNLAGGKFRGRQLIEPGTLKEIHTPCAVVGADPAGPPNSTYALGWFVDTYNGRSRLSHGGYLHHVNSSVMFFPDDGIGIVSFVNFGPSRLARLINQLIFDSLTGREAAETVEQATAQYEKDIANNRTRIESVPRVAGTSRSHALHEYAGTYMHQGYGRIEVRHEGEALTLVRGSLRLSLEHWHYDVWVVAENDLFEIHRLHAFDRSNRIAFESSVDGEIASFTMPLEPAVEPIRFAKDRGA